MQDLILPDRPNLFLFEHIRNGRIIDVIEFNNLVTVEGKNEMLDTYFSGDTQHTTWYMGLVNNSPTPSFSENDTLASHAGWSELTDYAGNRKEWVEATASGKSKGTTTPSEFTMNASGTINGAFIASVDTGTSGTLWAVGSFPSSVSFVSSDVFRASYVVNL